MLALVTFVEPTPHEYVVQIALRPEPDTRPGQVLPSAGRLAGVQAPESALVNTLEAFPFARCRSHRLHRNKVLQTAFPKTGHPRRMKSGPGSFGTIPKRDSSA